MTQINRRAFAKNQAKPGTQTAWRSARMHKRLPFAVSQSFVASTSGSDAAPATLQPLKPHHFIHAPLVSLRQALSWAELLPSLKLGIWVVVLFAVAVWLAQTFAAPIQGAIAAYPRLGVVLFVATSTVAVLVPALTNLPLLPVAVLAWGPWWTALLLLSGWVLGASTSFTLGRHAQPLIVRYLPSVRRHADIDRLIHPQHRMGSLILLRMTFPVDVLSYALGLFSRHTTVAEIALSTALGGAPFALLFSLVPSLPATAQLSILVASALVFACYMVWVLRRSSMVDDRSGG